MVIFYSSYNERIILLVVLLYVVPTECTDHTEAYGLKLFESTEWLTLRDARIHRNECLLRSVGTFSPHIIAKLKMRCARACGYCAKD